jgi:tetratricopeptide (TPR) repeat protein
MIKRFFLPLIASAVFILPLSSQTDYEYAVTRHKGNKVVLLGPANANDAGKWKQVIDSDGVYEHGFGLLDSGNISSIFAMIKEKNIDVFEAWFRQRYGLSSIAKWAALDVENNLIVTGVQTPSAKEFEQMLDQRGIKSPLMQVRDFLRENPGHLDAMTELLMEARRCALHVMPPDATEDLDTETDLRTWGVLAAETDRVFSGDWLGIDTMFFRPDQQQPERFSELMKAAFRKHIPKVELALGLEPTNKTLWNVWAWMARSLPDYNWATFINSMDTFNFTGIYLSSPSDEVCVWFVQEAMANSDWETVIKYAKIASSYHGPWVRHSSDRLGGWVPNNYVFGGPSIDLARISGYPKKSAYLPHLEALLRLGRIDEANEVYDEFIRRDSSRSAQSEAGAMAANTARAVGMEEIAAIYGRGRPIGKAPRSKPNPQSLSFAVFAENDDSGYYKHFVELIKQLAPRIDVRLTHWGQFDELVKQLGSGINAELPDLARWREDGESGWILIANDGRVMAKDSKIPAFYEMQTLYNRLGVEDHVESCKKYLAAHNGPPGLEIELAFEIMQENRVAFFELENQNSTPMNDTQDEALWGDATRYLSRMLAWHPELMANGNWGKHISPIPSSRQSSLLKRISRPMLANIEQLLERKPSSNGLWNQWLFWNVIDGNEHSVELLVDRINLSPIALGTLPPVSVINEYYEDCKKSGSWNKVIRLLKTAWDIEFSNIDKKKDKRPWGEINKGNFGDYLGIHLIEAYLQDNKPGEADEIFNAVLGIGGKFTDISKIVELAKGKGQDRLAREWGERVKK